MYTLSQAPWGRFELIFDINTSLDEKLERETRFELATPTLARLCSTTELFPHRVLLRDAIIVIHGAMIEIGLKIYRLN